MLLLLLWLPLLWLLPTLLPTLQVLVGHPSAGKKVGEGRRITITMNIPSFPSLPALCPNTPAMPSGVGVAALLLLTSSLSLSLTEPEYEWVHNSGCKGFGQLL